MTRDETRPTDGRAIADRLAQAPPRQRAGLIADHVRACAARILGASPESLDERQPLSERGLDSLMAVELRGRLGQGLALDRPLPATLLFDYPTLEALTGLLASELLGPAAAPLGDEPGHDEPAEIVSAVEGLSDEEAEAALLTELDAGSEVGS